MRNPATPTVSIVTPTLNQARFLPATLRSVRGQTYPVAEHIVVDGGSTDGTLDILRRAEAESGLRWTSRVDGGMYEAVNNGLAMATGDVVAYLPSDDAYLPWTVETVVDAFTTTPTLDLVFGDGVTIEEESGAQILRLYPPFDLRSLANYGSLLQPAVFWRRGLFDQLGGFDTSMRFVADLDFWLRAAAAGAAIGHIDEVLAVERSHEDRLSTASRDAMRREEARMRSRHAGRRNDAGARARAARRHLRWQRWLWLQFVVAANLRSLPGPWRRFLRDGRVTVQHLRALNGLRARRHGRWRGAIDSQLITDVVTGERQVRRDVRTAA
jgi:glycosyltransferase involved in cell wall biosynthesis